MRRIGVLLGALTLSLALVPGPASRSETALRIPCGLRFSQPEEIVAWTDEATIINDFTIADVTGDRLNDVVAVASPIVNYEPRGTPKLVVFGQLPDGQFGAPVVVADSPAAEYYMSVAAGDLDGDGKTDIAVATDLGIEVFYGHPSGLTEPILLSTPFANDVQVAEVFSAEGREVVANTDIGPIILSAIGGGQFERRTVAYEPQTALAIGDVTGDGRADIVGINSELNVFRQGSRSFSLARYSAGSDPSGVDVGDLNGDGRKDVAVSDHANQPRSGLHVRYQKPRGTLGSVTTHTSFDLPVRTAIVDMDGSNGRDVVASHAGWSAVGIHRARPNGGFMPECLYGKDGPDSDFPVGSLNVADLDGDGHRDMVVKGAREIFVMRRVPGRYSPDPASVTLSTIHYDTWTEVYGRVEPHHDGAVFKLTLIRRMEEGETVRTRLLVRLTDGDDRFDLTVSKRGHICDLRARYLGHYDHVSYAGSTTFAC